MSATQRITATGTAQGVESAMRIGRIPKTRALQQSVDAQHLPGGPPRTFARSLRGGRKGGLYRPLGDATDRADAPRHVAVLPLASGHRQRARRRLDSRHHQRIAGADSSRCHPTFGQDPVVASTSGSSFVRWRTATACSITPTTRRTRATRFGT